MKTIDRGDSRLIRRGAEAVLVFVILALAGEMGLAQERQASVVQQVYIEVKPIIQIRINGNPRSFFIQDPPATPNEYAIARDNSTSYSFLSNLDNMKIVASIDNPMPSGTKLMIGLASTKGTSSGIVDISDAVTPVTAVSGMSRGSDRDQPISYIFAANASAGEIRMGSRVITLTVSN